MKSLAIAVLFLAIGLLSNLAGDIIHRDDAMKVCELSHSHDVCFQALNR